MTTNPQETFCGASVRRTIELVGAKWSMLILWELIQGEQRYAALQRRVEGISQKVLSAELKRLGEPGLIDREVVPTVPPQVTYRITERGRSLRPVFESLDTWGREYADEP